MNVFVTGATGFIGKAVVRELITAGHSVTGLARSDSSVGTLAKMGAKAHRGDLGDTVSLVAGARAADGVIHLAFNHDFENTPRDVASETDRQVVEAMTGAMEGTNKPFVLTSGTAILAFSLPPGNVGTENDAPATGVSRGASEEAVLVAAKRGVRTSLIRLSPTVHGAGDVGFIPALIDIARRTGVAAYVGDGANRWPAVHRFDAARLFRLALEKAGPGTRLHGVAEEGIPMRSIAETIGAGLGVPVKSLTDDEAKIHFGWIAGFVGVDNPTASSVTRAALGWEPREVGLLEDMRESGYFTQST
ncbi:MAG: SDR family oxidoreductase [Armatimonadetes bacterium]|nr:SDR family oxidoreductase [Armatimonadota bacterium]